MESFDDEIRTFDKQQKQSIIKPVALGRRKQIVTQEDLDNYILVYLQYGSFVYFKWDQSSNRFHLKLIVGLHY